MRFELLFLPALVVSAPSLAEEYLSVAQAQALIFPGATFSSADFVMSDEQIAALTKETGGSLTRRQVKVWRASTGGWFFLDQVIVRDDRVTYALGLSDDGAVKGLEILACMQLYDGIRRPEWRAQFVGKRYGKVDMLDQISTISGSTLSTNHITAGVKRLLATFALFLGPKAS
ncbi:MAG TPA: FMN-binding protein [Steroidobacteraceae bacterium]|jgi:hypothetical protein